ncbi:MAG: 2-succinyl-5-enolpyruvyl-6-hydroxy-3-cyclohexene-1-carboxylic-acid synthase [Deltaproteobacteria bacterium]|nr:2-succinyl-5-enolpyruvyl-6-hydroxy-3-cyclohexene-1-carboxylic-acid synthase [Deltaproteobacteria bacterium]
MTPAAAPLTLLSEWSALLFDTLVKAGVREVIASPGSRSTPLVLAASRTPGLTVRDVIDERSAAFFALGQARATGRPSALICTSGTAPAHHFPAVIEASQARVPLIVLSADRPFELMDCGAPQTIDQTRLFGTHVRSFVELGVPEGTDLSLRSLRRRVVQAVHDAQWPTPGPVHVNVRAKKPLEPLEARDPAEREAAARVHALLTQPAPRAHLPDSAPSTQTTAHLAELLPRSERGLIVAGPGPLSQRDARGPLFSLLRKTGFTLAADATSQLRLGAPDFVPDLAPDLVFASSTLRGQAFDLVLQLGASPTSSAWEPFLAAQPRATHVVIAPHGWNDFTAQADELVCAPIAATLRALDEHLDGARAPLRPLQDAAVSIDRQLDAQLSREPALSELGAARALLSRLPEDALVMTGNSLPIRLLDAAAPRLRRHVDVLSQRGANGIDGLISGAAGAASQGKPVALLVGDTSFLHDLGGLELARALRTPLVLLVLQNGGGRIFEQLPVARAGLSERELSHFTTPHGLRFGFAAAQFSLPYRQVATPAALHEALDAAFAHPGASVIEAIVPEHGARDDLAALARTAEAAFAQAFARGAP